MSPNHATRLHQLEDRRWAALREGRWDDAVAQLHPDLRYTHASGATDTRDDYAARLRAGFYDYSGVHHTSDHTHLAGDTGIVWGTMSGSLGLGEAVKVLDSVTVTVWLRGEAGWQLLAAQSTPRRA